VALPTGLLPVLVFVLTVGIAAPVTLVAHLRSRDGSRSFATAFRTALVAAAGVYLVGVVAVWVVAGGLPLWEVAAALVAAGVAALAVLVVGPLLIGRRLVRQVRGTDPETALRFAAYGWVAAAFAVFGIFVAPGGLTDGHLLDLGGERTCLVGFCGVVVSLVGAVLLELAVAVLGPGLVGSALHSLAGRTRGSDASPRS
jgi:hypothetical protein